MRRMAHTSFRAAQEAGRYAAHVRPINELVDELSGDERGWMPHVAPAHGGVDARVLSRSLVAALAGGKQPGAIERLQERALKTAGLALQLVGHPVPEARLSLDTAELLRRGISAQIHALASVDL